MKYRLRVLCWEAGWWIPGPAWLKRWLRRQIGEATCEMDGETEDEYGLERYWHCERPGFAVVDGLLVCKEHAEMLGLVDAGGAC